MKKPYWNEELKNLWFDMYYKEKVYLNYRGTNHVRKQLQHKFLDASTVFNKTLRGQREITTNMYKMR